VTADLGVSIVSYRTPELLRRCLAAVAEHRTDLELEVMVVDNASGDGSADMVASEFAWVHVIRNQHNVGFGPGHNQALRALHARHFLVLNSDTEPRRGALPTLVRYLDAHADVAVVGPRLVYPDGRVQPSRRRFPTTATLFLESTQLQRFWPRNAVLDRYYVHDRDDVTEQDVDWLVGACLCVRASAAEQVGLFDERYFLYSEEIDWCRRFRQHGYRIVYLPTAEVLHHEGASTGIDLASRDRQFQSAKLKYAAKWHGPRVAGALRTYLVLEYGVRAVEEALKLALGSRVAERRARLRIIGSGMRHALRG
jgi:N-acetylglucosaminyl-diphospho-decaprenol L-rhamnosyltransferase